MYTVKNVMSSPVHTIAPETPVSDAMHTMKQLDKSSLVVPMPDGSFGIVTQRDIVGKVIAGGRDPEQTRVADICTAPIATIQQEASLRECSARMMDLKVRRLPVLDDARQLAGIITETDIFVAVEERGWGPDQLGSSKLRLIGTLARIRRTTVEDVMSKPVAQVAPDATVASALAQMAAQGISSLIVTPEAGAARYGIVTKRDIISKVVAANRDPAALHVAAIMSAGLYTIAPHVTLPQCAARMVELGVRRLTVTQDGHPVGIISDTDIFRVVEGRRGGPLDRRPLPRPDFRHITRSHVHTAADVMERQALRVPPGTTVSTALELMEAHGILSLLIEPRRVGGPLGIVTQRDIVSKIVAQERDPDELTVGEICSSPLITVTLHTSIGECSDIMTRLNIRRLPVQDGDDIVGIVSDTDIFAAVEERGWEAEPSAPDSTRAPQAAPAQPKVPARRKTPVKRVARSTRKPAPKKPTRRAKPKKRK
ncbi:MAG: CBS domain-containing protein [Chloroflexi bacterium]|nr:CBS domain-containing protein [Chloroflexota bacterium]